MEKLFLIFVMNILTLNLFGQIITKENNEIINIYQGRNPITICFNQNNCKDKVYEILNENESFKILTDTKKRKLLATCSIGPKTEYEVYFCKIALTMCGIQDPNNCK